MWCVPPSDNAAGCIARSKNHHYMHTYICLVFSASSWARARHPGRAYPQSKQHKIQRWALLAHPNTYIHTYIRPPIHPGLYIILYSILLASCAVQPSDPPCHRLAHRGCSEQRAQGLPSLHMAVTFLLRLSQSTHELSAERAGVGNAAANSVCLSLCRTRQSSTAIAIAIATITTNSRPLITDDGGGHRGRGSRPL